MAVHGRSVVDTTRCEICYQPATKKCTSCGKVFCDLHVRYGGSAGGLYGGAGEVGYYCDECWDTRVKKRRTVAVVLVAVGVLLLALNLLGVLVLRGSFSLSGGPVWIATSVVALLVIMGVAVLMGRR
jgi:hypothetical protein